MLYAMFAMIVLTFSVAIRLLLLRIAAVRSKKVSLGVFRLNTSDDIPPEIMQASRNYSNQFEVPVLFYAVGALALGLHLQTNAMIFFGWMFVAVRIIHSWIHLTNNNVIHRMYAFLVSNVCVLLIWVLLLWEYTVHR